MRARGREKKDLLGLPMGVQKSRRRNSSWICPVVLKDGGHEADNATMASASPCGVTFLHPYPGRFLVDVVRMRVCWAAVLGRICRSAPPLMRNSEVQGQVPRRANGGGFELNVAPLLALTRCHCSLRVPASCRAAGARSRPRRVPVQKQPLNSTRHDQAYCRGGASCRRTACGGGGQARVWGRLQAAARREFTTRRCL
jgi:hypothetical protein